MAISHLCSRCGNDLAGVRAPPDPRYGLAVVICPVCGVASVRRRDAVVMAWRRARGVATAFVLLIVQATILMTLLAGFIVPVVEIEQEYLPGSGVDGWLDLVPALATGRLGHLTEVVLLLVVWLGAAVASGIWLGAALGHWKRPALWASWASILFGTTLITVFVGLVEATYEPTRWPGFAREQFTDLTGRGLMLVVFLSVSLVGVPLGRAIARTVPPYRRALWRVRRRSRTRAREGT